MGINYTIASKVQAANFTMITNGTAFDTSPAQIATMLQSTVNDMNTALTILTGAGAAPPQLAATIVIIENLISHLNNHYKNLVTNLRLVTSGISDAIGYGVIGQPGAPSGSITNPTASLPNYFGSIMGSSNSYMGQAANLIAGVSAQAAGLLAGAILAELSTSTDASIQNVLGSLANLDTLNGILQNLTPGNLTILSTTMTNLGQLLSSAGAGSYLIDSPELARIMSALGLTAS